MIVIILIKINLSEKIILSVSGEKRADILSKQEELQNIDKVYASNCVRTLSTAKYLLARQNLKVNDEILSNDRGKKVAVFTHGYAITFLLLNWCKLEEIRESKE